MQGLELCDKCGRGVDHMIALRVKRRSTGERVALHPECLEEARANKERLARESSDLCRTRVEVGLRSIPQVPWTNAEDPELENRLHPLFRRFAKNYDPREHRSALLLGPSGSGKTLSVSLALRRIANGVLASETDAYWFARTMWITAHDLVKAAKEEGLGKGECATHTRAKGASVLVIDETGFEPKDPCLFGIIDERYARRQPTIVTSGQTFDEFVARNGDAMRRRLAGRDAGLLFDAHKGGK